MAIPVIIPAFNEERRISSTLDALPREGIRPIVAVNGSSDRTADIARQTGAEVVDLPDQGKLPAIQHVLKMLNQAALESLLVIDADTRPILPNSWLKGMTEELAQNEGRPLIVGGPILFTGPNVVSNLMRSVRRAKRATHAKTAGPEAIYQTDPNMGLVIHNEETLDAILNLPHYWPGEGLAIARTIINHGGSISQVTNPALTALTPVSAAQLGVIESTRIGYDEARRVTRQRYVDRGAHGSRAYEN